MNFNSMIRFQLCALLALGLGIGCGPSAMALSEKRALEQLPVACVEDAFNNRVDEQPSKSEFDDKVRTVYDTANAYNIPPMIIAGSIIQESSAVDQPIGPDSDNWTCGPAQFSVIAWCNWASVQKADLQAKIGWPRDEVLRYQKAHPGVDICAENKFLAREDVKPFEDIALQRLHGRYPDAKPGDEGPYYAYPKPISYGDVASAMKQISKSHQVSSTEDAAAEHLRYAITKSFAENCSNHRYAYPVLAFTLTQIRDTFPKEVRDAQTVHRMEDDGSSPVYNCQQPVMSNGDPLQISWLIADAIYNAGPSLWVGIADYQQHQKISWDQFGPLDLVKAIDHAITPAFGMWGIGPVEAKYHISGVVTSITQPGKTIVPPR